MLKGLRRSLKSLGKNKIFRGIGKVADLAGDFVPIPGVRDALNIGGKLMQGQNLKRSLIGAGLDYAGGKIGGALAGKARALVHPGAAASAAGAGASLVPKPSADPFVDALMRSKGVPAAAVSVGGGLVSSGVNRAAPVMTQGLGSQVLSGAKRALGGLKASDVIKGAAAGYDIYSREKDAAYNRKRLADQDRMYKEDRARDIAMRDKYNAASQAYFDSNADLRAAGKAGMMDWSKPDLSALFTLPPRNTAPITTPDWATLNPSRRPLR